MFRLSLPALLAALLLLPTASIADPVLMRDLYERDLSFSQFALDMEGERITVQGYMAPPLKAESTFFVLTKMPMSVCPFCETEAEWPADIILVRTDRVLNPVPFNYPIEVEGVLSIGTQTDDETGFVSRVRLVEATFSRM